MTTIRNWYGALKKVLVPSKESKKTWIIVLILVGVFGIASAISSCGKTTSRAKVATAAIENKDKTSSESSDTVKRTRTMHAVIISGPSSSPYSDADRDAVEKWQAALRGMMPAAKTPVEVGTDVAAVLPEKVINLEELFSKADGVAVINWQEELLGNRSAKADKAETPVAAIDAVTPPGPTFWQKVKNYTVAGAIGAAVVVLVIVLL